MENNIINVDFVNKTTIQNNNREKEALALFESLLSRVNSGEGLKRPFLLQDWHKELKMHVRRHANYYDSIQKQRTN